MGRYVNMPEVKSIGGYLTIQYVDGILMDAPFQTFKPRVNLQNLKSIGGDFQIVRNKALDSVSTGALTYIGGDIIISENDALQRMPSLAITEAKKISVSGNKRIEWLQIPDLKSVSTHFQVFLNERLLQVNLLSLETVGSDATDLSHLSFSIATNAVLKTIIARKLSNVHGSFQVNNNFELTDLKESFGALERITGHRAEIKNNKKMTEVYLTSLVTTATLMSSDLASELEVTDNAMLTNLYLPKLNGRPTITGNNAELRVTLPCATANSEYGVMKLKESAKTVNFQNCPPSPPPPPPSPPLYAGVSSSSSITTFTALVMAAILIALS